MTGSRPLLRAAALLALAFVAIQPQARAQEAAGEAAASPDTGPGEQSAVTTAVARSARLGFLYFLASRNDYTRLNAEIAQLKVEDPSWMPPADLFDQTSADRTGIDDTRFWAAYRS